MERNDKWHFETFKRLVDNLEFRVNTHRHFQKKPTKRVTWFQAYYRISKTIFRNRVEVDYSFRDFYRKLNNRFYQKFSTSDWTNPIKRICDRDYSKSGFRLSSNAITYMTEKVYRISGQINERKVSHDWTSSLSSICRKLQKEVIKNQNQYTLEEFHHPIQIIIHRLYWAYGFNEGLEKIVLRKIIELSKNSQVKR